MHSHCYVFQTFKGHTSNETSKECPRLLPAAKKKMASIVERVFNPLLTWMQDLKAFEFFDLQTMSCVHPI